MNFEIFTPSRIIFNCGAFEKLGSMLSEYGKRVFVVCSPSATRNGVIHNLKTQVVDNGIDIYVYDNIKGEPSPESVDNAAKEAIAFGADIILGIGGGSAIDTAKAVCGLVTNFGSVEDYLEGVGNGAVIINRPLPFIAVPTTSGTGAEATKNAVISSEQKHYKKSFRDARLLPKLVVIDPLLTISLPKNITASCGMDAITQLIESYTSIKSNAYTEGLCLQGIKKIPSLLKAYEHHNDVSARSDMAFCALLSGIALANSGLGAAHGFASGIGAYSGVSHGMACAVLLPHVMRLNAEVAAEKYANIGRILCGEDMSQDEAVIAAIEYIENMNKTMNIPVDFKSWDITASAEEIARASMGGSMTGNPVPIDMEKAIEFIQELL